MKCGRANPFRNSRILFRYGTKNRDPGHTMLTESQANASHVRFRGSPFSGLSANSGGAIREEDERGQGSTKRKKRWFNSLFSACFPSGTGYSRTLRHSKFIVPKTGKLKSDSPEEDGVIEKIALPQSPRLQDQPVTPLQSSSFHPAGRITQEASMNIEGCTDSEHEFRLDSRQVFRHEAFLFGCAQSDPKNIGPKPSGDPQQLTLFLCLEPAKRGSISTDDPDAGKFCRQDRA